VKVRIHSRATIFKAILELVNSLQQS